MNENVEVVVVGGGYGGVTAANRPARHDGVSVTPVNPRADFVSRIRQHQLVTGSDDTLEGFGEVLGGKVALVVDTPTRIDAAERKVTRARRRPPAAYAGLPGRSPGGVDLVPVRAHDRGPARAARRARPGRGLRQ